MFKLYILLSTIVILTFASEVRIIKTLEEVQISNYQEGSPGLVLFKSGKQSDLLVPIIKKLSEDKSDNHDIVEMTVGTEDTSEIVFINVERKVKFQGPMDLNAVKLSLQQFDIGSRVALFTDSNFEHDTQASTGSTTGDWLIIFDKLTPETVAFYEGLSLLHRANRINVGIADIEFAQKTYKRFEIGESVSRAIFLRKKFFYTFPEPLDRKTMTLKLLNFALKEYHKFEGLPVPRPLMFFDEFLDHVFVYFKTFENKHGSKRAFVALGSILMAGFSLLVLAIYLLAEKMRKAPQEPEEKSKKE